VAVIGYGYWGPNLARNFTEVSGGALVAICDERPEKRELAGSRHPGVRVVAYVDDLLQDHDVDAVVIATPISTHADLALRALRAGKHVLVEKPLAGTVEQGRAVVEEARACNRTLMVDHTFVYMGAVRKVKEIIDAGRLGDLYYVDSVRVNLGLFQHDASVVWDLAVHDLSIMSYWVGQPPIAISCVGVSHVPGLPEDVAYLTIYYPGSLIGHVNVNWLSPVKVRRTIIAGSDHTIVFDDLSPDEKIKLYSRGVTREEELVGDNLIPLVYRRTGDIWIPQFDQTEALRVMAEHFVESCRTGMPPLTGGREGLEIVRMLEAAEQSMKSGGAKISIDTPTA
jgi:predicted dehydrogenase